MKKTIRILVMSVFGLAIAFVLTGCDDKVTLKAQIGNGISIDVPSDFGEFSEVQGTLLATDEDQVATITISQAADGKGVKPSDFTQTLYQAQVFPDKDNVEFIKFDNPTNCSGIPAIFSNCKIINSNDIPVTVSTYVLFFDDGNIQTVSIAYNSDGDSSTKTNIEAITKSIKPTN